jgi:hypothetical protein
LTNRNRQAAEFIYPVDKGLLSGRQPFPAQIPLFSPQMLHPHLFIQNNNPVCIAADLLCTLYKYASYIIRQATCIMVLGNLHNGAR